MALEETEEWKNLCRQRLIVPIRVVEERIDETQEILFEVPSGFNTLRPILTSVAEMVPHMPSIAQMSEYFDAKTSLVVSVLEKGTDNPHLLDSKGCLGSCSSRKGTFNNWEQFAHTFGENATKMRESFGTHKHLFETLEASIAILKPPVMREHFAETENLPECMNDMLKLLREMETDIHNKDDLDHFIDQIDALEAEVEQILQKAKLSEVIDEIKNLLGLIPSFGKEAIRPYVQSLDAMNNVVSTSKHSIAVILKPNPLFASFVKPPDIATEARQAVDEMIEFVSLNEYLGAVSALASRIATLETEKLNALLKPLQDLVDAAEDLLDALDNVLAVLETMKREVIEQEEIQEQTVGYQIKSFVTGMFE